jgi:DNA mismatch repair protein MutS2
MDVQTIRTLEFDLIQGILKRYAASPPGLSEIEALSIQLQPGYIQSLLDCVEEMRFLLKSRGKPSLQGNQEIRPLLQEIRVEGSVVGTDALLSVLSVIRTGEGFKRLMSGESENLARLSREAKEIASLTGLKKEIEGIVDDRGEIRDSASRSLEKIRRQIRKKKEEIREKLERTLSSRVLAPVVQEKLITIRNGRYVIPLKPEFSSRIEGIIHDRSSSGVTVYVEPSQTVEMNNRLSRLASEEEEEIRRILLQVTDSIRLQSSALAGNVEVLARMDLHLAKALFAEDFQGVCPEILDERRIHFKGARHPLLLDRGDKAETEAVPIELRLGDDFSTLIITGPNTGGKTVALKTLGLLVLMAQAGIPIPVAEGSAMGIYNDIFADIGDDQSIQDDLSTFSSHVRNICHILEHAVDGTLVLLDEIGTGTDPREGAALGIAVLEKLQEKGCHVAATTHYEEIKHHAYRKDGMINASVAFDAERLCPAYRLQYGHLGTSRAFEISERLGMSQEIILWAKAELSEAARNMTELIEELEANIADNQAVRRQLHREREKTEASLAGRVREQERAVEKTNQTLAKARAELREIRKRSKEILKTAEAGDRTAVDRELARMKERLEELDVSMPAVEAEDLPDIEPGLAVEIVGTNKRGLVVGYSRKKGRAQVLCDEVKLEVPVERLKAAAPAAGSPKIEMALDGGNRAAGTVPASLNLVGLRAEEAQRKTVAYIDDAHMGNLRRIQIIHGFGTGALRKAVAEALKAHPLVAAFHSGSSSEGGAGVTVVELIS